MKDPSFKNNEPCSQSDDIHQNSESSSTNKPKLTKGRLIFGIFTTAFLAFNSNTSLIVPGGQSLDIKDLLHITTEPLNNYLKSNSEIRSWLINVSALIQDITLVFSIIIWYFKSTNWKLPISIIFFYSIKLACAVLFSFKPPEGALWGSPFFSMTFTQSEDWNYFFSGLLGLNIICFIHINNNKFSSVCQIMKGLSFFNLSYQLILFAALRSNYLIDLFTSLVVGHYSTYVGDILDRYMPHINDQVEGRCITEVNDKKRT